MTGQPDQSVKTAHPAEGECGSCGEGIPEQECPESKRPCGHHCNHVWTHDICDWCGTEFGDTTEAPEAAEAVYCVQDDARLGPRCSGCPGCPPCVFCQIATGATRAEIADEGDAWTSFPPLEPHAPGHMLFIPRRHVRDATVEPALTGTVFAAASAYLGRVLRSDGNLLTSVGAAATQAVEHLHVHVIPRGPDDGLYHDWPWMRGAAHADAAATRAVAAVEALVFSEQADEYRAAACQHVVAQPYADNRYVRLLDDVRAAIAAAQTPREDQP